MLCAWCVVRVLFGVEALAMEVTWRSFWRGRSAWRGNGRAFKKQVLAMGVAGIRGDQVVVVWAVKEVTAWRGGGEETFWGRGNGEELHRREGGGREGRRRR